MHLNLPFSVVRILRRHTAERKEKTDRGSKGETDRQTDTERLRMFILSLLLTEMEKDEHRESDREREREGGRERERNVGRVRGRKRMRTVVGGREGGRERGEREKEKGQSGGWGTEIERK